jgi:hypothetical protein
LELESVRGRLNFPIERDLYFTDARGEGKPSAAAMVQATGLAGEGSMSLVVGSV